MRQWPLPLTHYSERQIFHATSDPMWLGFKKILNKLPVSLRLDLLYWFQETHDDEWHYIQVDSYIYQLLGDGLLYWSEAQVVEISPSKSPGAIFIE